MRIVKSNVEGLSDVLGIEPGTSFETQGRIFLRTHTIQMAIIDESVPPMHNIVGVDLENGGYYMTSMRDEDAEHRMVKVVDAAVTVQPEVAAFGFPPAMPG